MQRLLLIILAAFVLGCICKPYCKSYNVDSPWAIKGFDKKNCDGKSVGRDSGSWSIPCRKFKVPAASVNAVARKGCKVDVWHATTCKGEPDFSTEWEKEDDAGFLGTDSVWRLKQGIITGAVSYYKATCK
jgi:hypothetical protein